MMRRLLLILMSFFLTVGIYAEHVNRSEALKKAQQFMPGRQFVDGKTFARGDKDATDCPFYVFNAKNSGGYVIVSGDDRTTEIIGYSKTGNLNLDQIPENLKCWLDGYARQIEALGTSAKPVQKAQTRGVETWSAISPLIETKWDQYAPYNYMCPDGNYVDYDEPGYDVNKRCVTGCVATAMAQIMYFWEWPKTCEAIDSYGIGYWENQGTDYSPNWVFVEEHRIHGLPATTFKWDKMKKTYNGGETGEVANAIAELLRYCGQAVNMDYSIYSSSAGVYPDILAGVFEYSKNIRLLYHDLYTTSEWEDMIYAELAAGRPVLYGGQTRKGGGHQFIVDGYDGSGLFHMNWGWSGMSDDYYVLSLADPDDQGIGGSATNSAYQFDQDALIGIQPPVKDEVLTPLMESHIEAMGTREYLRTSATDDFIDVVFDGLVYAHYNQPSTKNLDVQLGWALCQDGQIKQVVSEDLYTFTKGSTYDGFYTDTNVTFGVGLALGKYQVCQVFKFVEDEDWSLCAPYRDTAFLMADVTATKLTIRQAEKNSSFKVNSIATNDFPLSGSPMSVKVNVTNESEALELVINLYAQKQGETSWKLVGVATRKIDPGVSEDVTMSFTPSVDGTYSLKVTNNTSDEALATKTVTVYGIIEKVINYVTYVCHTGTLEATVKSGNATALRDKDVIILSTVEVDGKTYKVKKIADRAFFQVLMRSLTIQPGVEEIGDDAFWNAYQIQQLIIPSSVKRIGAGAFQYCYWMDSIELPASLTSIGDYAFGDLNSLESVVSYITNPFDIADNVFGIMDGDVVNPSTATLTVPNGTLGKYQTAAGWNVFQAFKEMEALSSEPGDVNGDGVVDNRDIEGIADLILSGIYDAKADMNEDGKVDATDIVLLVKMIKEK